VVRGGATTSLQPLVQRRLRELDPGVAVVMGTLRERLDRSLANRRFVMSVLTGSSLLALVLASIGLYAVLSYSVARRTRELAVRSALGATRPQLLWLVFGGAARVVLAGTAIGIVGSLALGWSMRVFLVDITPFDPLTLLLTALVLIFVAILAVVIPARRATRAHPAWALQAE
jgi:ABC-type antimicrobial peptide transport system permease subunit